LPPSSNKCLTCGSGYARVKLMAESLQTRRGRILRYLARRARAGDPPPSVREVASAAGQVALMGRIAGWGLEAVAMDEAYSLASELLVTRSGRRRYLLRVVGQSMVGAGIEDGDLLVVEEDEVPPDGSVIVALLRDGEEVTVKRLYREEGGTVRLGPENGDHEELVLPSEDVRVQGRVVYVVHPPKGRATEGGA
jgi:repressor LexA